MKEIALTSLEKNQGEILQFRFKRENSGILNLRYDIFSEHQDILWQADSFQGACKRKDLLWQHSCLEFFLFSDKNLQYYELNFSVDGYYAAYLFANYRKKTADLSVVTPPQLKFSQIKNQDSVSIQFNILEILGDKSCENLWIKPCVILEKKNKQNFWSDVHQSSTPDFHRASFLNRF